MLDPWNDARTIAERLNRTDVLLVAVLGAEAWCERCRALRPHFDAAARVAGSDIWVWLDIEDHAEFIGDGVPPDLPWLLVQRGRLVLFEGRVEPTAQALLEALAGRSPPGSTRQADWSCKLRDRLLRQDWSV